MSDLHVGGNNYRDIELSYDFINENEIDLFGWKLNISIATQANDGKCYLMGSNHEEKILREIPKYLYDALNKFEDERVKDNE